MKIAGILFDKDGTLIDFYKVWQTATEPVIERIFQTYKIENLKRNKEVILKKLGIEDGKINPNGALAWKTYPMIAEDLAPVLQQMVKDTEICTKEFAEQLSRFYEEETNKNCNQEATFTDLSKLMDTLAEKKISIGIVTTDTYKATIKCLKNLGILQYFSFFSMDQMPIPMPIKPDGKIIKRASEYWEIKPEEILVVGDTPNDMQFAHNGGAVAVGVLSGTGGEQDLLSAADYLIQSVKDLPRLIEELETC